MFIHSSRTTDTPRRRRQAKCIIYLNNKGKLSPHGTAARSSPSGFRRPRRKFGFVLGKITFFSRIVRIVPTVDTPWDALDAALIPVSHLSCRNISFGLLSSGYWLAPHSRHTWRTGLSDAQRLTFCMILQHFTGGLCSGHVSWLSNRMLVTCNGCYCQSLLSSLIKICVGRNSDNTRQCIGIVFMRCLPTVCAFNKVCMSQI